MSKIAFAKLLCIVAACGIASHVDLTAQTFNYESFEGSNGANPQFGPLLQGIDGNFYGTTAGGGTSSYCGSYGCGTVFKVKPRGGITTVYNFCSQPNCTDGSSPFASLIQATDGNFYGTTGGGGGGRNSGGTVFKLTPAGELTTLYSFCSLLNCADGLLPSAGLVQATNGNLYGTTQYGGANFTPTCLFGCGTLFEITPNGELTTLYNFCSETSCWDGYWPNSVLVQATDGNLYGTTPSYGTSLLYPGAGTIFRVTLQGNLTPVHHFSYDVDGGNPNSLVQGTDGSLYGTTQGGLDNDPSKRGTIFKLGLQGEFSVLAKYCIATSCLTAPEAGLVQANDGNFYGTTVYGGKFNDGAIFQLTPSGEVTPIYSFCPAGCGYAPQPEAPMTQGTNGTLYGTTVHGGTVGAWEGNGTIFSLSLGLPPFVEASPNFARAGETVGILGNDLESTTNVSFNGSPTTFTTISDTFIRATVPTGATSGTIQVTTADGTLSSTIAFQVLP